MLSRSALKQNVLLRKRPRQHDLRQKRRLVLLSRSVLRLNVLLKSRPRLNDLGPSLRLVLLSKGVLRLNVLLQSRLRLSDLGLRLSDLGLSPRLVLLSKGVLRLSVLPQRKLQRRHVRSRRNKSVVSRGHKGLLLNNRPSDYGWCVKVFNIILTQYCPHAWHKKRHFRWRFRKLLLLLCDKITEL